MRLRDAWTEEAENWLRWVRGDSFDAHWQWARRALLDLLPPPGRLTVDIGCGEGRLARELQGRGHRVLGVDVSPTLVVAAREADPHGEYVEGDAEHLPLADGAADLAVAYMCLMNLDDVTAAVREAARVLEPGGRFCFVVVHPFESAADRLENDLRISGSYLETYRYDDVAPGITFHNVHRPLEEHARAVENAGLLVEALREPRIPDEADIPTWAERWRRLPLALVIRAVRL